MVLYLIRRNRNVFKNLKNNRRSKRKNHQNLWICHNVSVVGLLNKALSVTLVYVKPMIGSHAMKVIRELPGVNSYALHFYPENCTVQDSSDSVDKAWHKEAEEEIYQIRIDLPFSSQYFLVISCLPIRSHHKLIVLLHSILKFMNRIIKPIISHLWFQSLPSPYVAAHRHHCFQET